MLNGKEENKINNENINLNSNDIINKIDNNNLKRSSSSIDNNIIKDENNQNENI